MARAITVLILSQTLWVSACNPDLQRAAGRLSVRAAGLPSPTQQVDVQLTSTGAPYAQTIPAATPDTSFAVDSVPAGPVTVRLRALGTNGEVLAEKNEMSSISTGETTQLTIFFGGAGSDAGVSDGGTELLSAPIPLFVRGLRDSSLSAGRLSGSGSADANSLDGFVAAARAALGRDPSRIEVRAIRMVLLTQVSDVTVLDELFTSVTATIRGRDTGGALAVASGSPTGVSANLDVAAEQSQMASLLSEMLSSRFAVELEGPSPMTPQDRFEADIELQIIYAAIP